MKNVKPLLTLVIIMMAMASCDNNSKTVPEATAEPVAEESQAEPAEAASDNKYWAEDFADVRMHRYYVASWDELTKDQQTLLYYLYNAALAGRDIIYDQNYKHNLKVRKTLEGIMEHYEGERSGDDWDAFVTYTKRVWVANGVHHHYAEEKFKPGFSAEYFATLTSASSNAQWPIPSDMDETSFWDLMNNVLFDPSFDGKKVNKSSDVDMLVASACNYYDGVTQEEAENFYKQMKDPKDETPIWYGLNSTLVKRDGQIVEDVWKVGGKYTEAIEKIVFWLKKAATVAENEKQEKALTLLAKYYETGDLKDWDAYNIAWIDDTESVVDVINGFIEVYGDPLGKKASFESVVQITDLEASKQMAVVAEQANWFEANSSIMDEHKKAEVTGISYKVIEAVMEGGDCSPTGPIGINLPNSNWIRETHGSKSVSLGNIVLAYDRAAGKGMLGEFAHDEEEIKRAEEHGVLAGKLHTALHEVIGHASGKTEPGVGTPKETLLNYASTLEEARADLVALYYLMDNKLVEMELMPSLEVGKAEYDSYIRNGLMTQLKRIEEGKDIEEDHMRNRQMVAAWVFEKGEPDNVISRIERDGKFFYEINDYEKLRVLFGDLLKEVQRIKSQGDYKAGKEMVESYGVKVDSEMHKQVLARVEKLNVPAYGAFVNPRLVADEDENGNVTNVSIEYPADFKEQMMRYGKENSFLPIK